MGCTLEAQRDVFIIQRCKNIVERFTLFHPQVFDFILALISRSSSLLTGNVYVFKDIYSVILLGFPVIVPLIKSLIQTASRPSESEAFIAIDVVTGDSLTVGSDWGVKRIH